MEKKRGFVFVETIIVTAILLASLMLVYSLFVSNKNEETKRLRYDDTAKLYETYYLKQYFESFDLNVITSRINNSMPYQYIYKGQFELFGESYHSESIFFSKIWDRLHVTSILIVPYDLTNILKCQGRANDLCSNKELLAYLNTLDSSDLDNTNGKYRLIVEYTSKLDGNACESSSQEPCFHYFSNVLLEPKL